MEPILQRKTIGFLPDVNCMVNCKAKKIELDQVFWDE